MHAGTHTHTHTHTQSNKWRIQEKGKQAVRALEWKGDHLFCGFDMGRVVQIKINIHEGTLSPLTFPGNYGSTVTQLSCKGNTLLVSTVERTWVVNTETHKLEQVSQGFLLTCRAQIHTCMYTYHTI